MVTHAYPPRRAPDGDPASRTPATDLVEAFSLILRATAPLALIEAALDRWEHRP